MPKVSVVILNWNGWKDTVACIESIKKENSKNLDIEIIVVDNASTDESVDKISKLKNIVILQNKKNLGFAGGNNEGIKYALQNKAEYVCVLNNDTEVGKKFFEELVKTLAAHPDAGIVSPKIYFASGYEFHKDRYKKSDSGRVIWYAGGKMDWNNVYGSNFGVDEVDSGQFDEDCKTEFATGACLFAKREVFEQIGLFNEKYYLYLEDADLSMRAKKSGYEVWYTYKPIMWHKVSQSSGIGSKLNDYFITRNRMLFGFTYASLRTKIALIRESIKFIISGREWQRIGVIDYYLVNFGKGSWKN